MRPARTQTAATLLSQTAATLLSQTAATLLSLTAATLLALLLAGCGGGSGATKGTGSSKATGAFTTGFLAFQQATNELGRSITPLEKKISASTGNPVRMSVAFAALGAREQKLADRWHPAVVAFGALKPPPSLASVFAATTADATRVYSSLRAISAHAHAASSILTRSQFATAGKDLETFSSSARALASDLGRLNRSLGAP